METSFLLGLLGYSLVPIVFASYMIFLLIREET